MADTAPTTLKLARESTLQSLVTGVGNVQSAISSNNPNNNLASLITAVNGVKDAITAEKSGFEILDEIGKAQGTQGAATLHNSYYRGKNLGSNITEAQSAAIRAGTFEDLYLGDYWQRSITYQR